MHATILIVRNVFIEFWALFGIFLTGGAVLTYLSRWTNNVCGQFLLPRLGFYLFGIIGIPVHELSHAIFCKIFFHDVDKVKWFDPKGKGGSHGSVTHSYQPWNLYQRIGHFFIGLGPTILGPILLGALFYFLVPGGRALFQNSGQAALAHLPTFLADFGHLLLSRSTLSSPGFYLFVYLAICISSQIELSGEDLKQVLMGTIPILLVLVILNVASWAVGGGWHERSLAIGSQAVSVMACLFVFASLLSVLSLVLLTGVFGLVNLACGRHGVNPFTNAA